MLYPSISRTELFCVLSEKQSEPRGFAQEGETVPDKTNERRCR